MICPVVVQVIFYDKDERPCNHRGCLSSFDPIAPAEAGAAASV
jgi:hypothetical protein